MSYIGNNPNQQAFTPAVDYFNGTGSATAFTLSRPVASVAQVQVTIENVPQNPASAFTVSGSTITFTSAPPSGTSNIYVTYTSPITQVITPGQGTVTATSMASSTGTGAGVFQTSPTITTPTISSLSSASATALTLQSAGTTAITVDTSQNVGIGTASPNALLHLSKNSGAADLRMSVGGTLYLNMYASASDTTFNNVAATPLIFETTNTERMRIDSSGNLLVGTTTAVSTFTASGTSNVAYISQTTGAGYPLQLNAQSNAGSYYILNFLKNGTGISNITSNGTTISYNTGSDYRLKNNIQPLTSALETVSKLKPVKWDWKEFWGEGSSQGFVAHELQSVVPECVTGEKDAVETYTDEDGNEQTRPKYQGIDTSFLVATLTAAIQEQQALITQLQTQITALNAKVGI